MRVTVCFAGSKYPINTTKISSPPSTTKTHKIAFIPTSFAFSLFRQSSSSRLPLFFPLLRLLQSRSRQQRQSRDPRFALFSRQSQQHLLHALRIQHRRRLSH